MSAYVKFEGVTGECTDKSFTGWTNINSVTLTATKPGEGLTGQSRRRGDVKLEDIQCTKELDVSSISLGKNICIGKVFKKVWIVLTASYNTGVEASGGRQKYLDI